MSTGPVEAKVKAATFGAATAGLLVWALESYVFKGAVPMPVQAFVDLVVPAALAFVFGYAARHTFRDDPDAAHTREAPPRP